MKKTTKKRINETVKVRIEVTKERAELVKRIDKIAKAMGISRSKLCANILATAVADPFFCPSGVTSLKTDKTPKTSRTARTARTAKKGKVK